MVDDMWHALGKKPIACRVWVGRLKERDHFEDLHVGRRILLK